MNNQEKYKEDILRQYINVEKTEIAPEGFTTKVMTRVMLETMPSMAVERSWKRNLIPVIFASVTVLLIVAAILIPYSQSDSLTPSLIRFLKNINTSMPEVNLSSIFKLTIPTVTIYVFVGIFILTLFDRALHGIFKR